MPRGLSAEIAGWMNQKGQTGWYLKEDGTIHVKTNMYVNDFNIKRFPVVISSIDGKLSCNCPKLISVQGMPSVYKELVFKGTFFLSDYYTEAIQQNRDLGDVILDHVSAGEIKAKLEEGFPDEDIFDILKEYFPKVYREYRGSMAGKKFGF